MGTNPDDPIYPFDQYNPDDPSFTEHLGLTKREYFAAIILSGICGTGLNSGIATKDALTYADALITRLNQEIPK